MNKSALPFALLPFCLMAATCNAQNAVPEWHESIPDWVKVEKAVLGENTSPHGEVDSRFQFEPGSVTEHLSRTAYPGHGGNKYFESFRKIDETPASTAFPKASDSPPERDLHPAVSTARGWSVSMPNLRKNVAKLLMQHKF